MSTLVILLEQFLKKIDNHKDIWWGLANQAARLEWFYTNLYYSSNYSQRSKNPYQTNINSYRGQSRYYVNLTTEQNNCSYFPQKTSLTNSKKTNLT